MNLRSSVIRVPWSNIGLNLLVCESAFQCNPCSLVTHGIWILIIYIFCMQKHLISSPLPQLNTSSVTYSLASYMFVQSRLQSGAAPPGLGELWKSTSQLHHVYYINSLPNIYFKISLLFFCMSSKK